MRIAYALILHVETTLNVFNSVLVFLWVLRKDTILLISKNNDEYGKTLFNFGGIAKKYH